MATQQSAPNPNLSTPCFAVPQHVASRSFPSEMVLLNLNTGQYHGLNPTGGRMFEVISEHGDFDRSAAALAAEFDRPLETVRSDLRGLCENLVERGLLEPAEA